MSDPLSCSNRNWLAAALVTLWWLTGADALGTTYVHDAKTTYCWKIPKPFIPSSLSPQDAVEAVSGDGCPLEITLSLAKTSYQISENVSVKWQVVANFTGSNRLQHEKLFWAQEPTTGAIAQIVHSNVHSCEYNTGCDPFHDGQNFADKTPNQVANFTDNRVTFHAKELVFQDPGEYSVLAHLILPDQFWTTRYDYAVYTRVRIDERSAATPTTQQDNTKEPATSVSTSTSNGNQTIVIVAIIGGVVVVLGVLGVIALVVRRRHKPPRAYDDQATVASSMFNGIPPMATVGGDDNDDKDTVMFDSPTSGWHEPPPRARLPENCAAGRSTGFTRGSSSMSSSSDSLSLGLPSMTHSIGALPSHGRSIQQYHQVRDGDIEL